MAPWPWSYYASLIRVASNVFKITPPVLWGMYEWEIGALLGADLVDETGAPVSGKKTARQQIEQRAAEMDALPEEVKADRAARIASRANRKAQQKADPAWKAQVKAAQQSTVGQVQTVPGRVIPSDDYEIVRARNR